MKEVNFEDCNWVTRVHQVMVYWKGFFRKAGSKLDYTLHVSLIYLFPY